MLRPLGCFAEENAKHFPQLAMTAKIVTSGPAAEPGTPVPTLIRFLVIVGLLVGLVYGGMIALVVMVKVQPREMSQTVEIPKAPK